MAPTVDLPMVSDIIDNWTLVPGRHDAEAAGQALTVRVCSCAPRNNSNMKTMISTMNLCFSPRLLIALALLALVSAATGADGPVKAAAAGKDSSSPSAVVHSVNGTNVVIFRNNRSWNRKPDFEEALAELGHKYDVRKSAEIGTTELSNYHTVIIPGSQRKDDFYGQYMENAELFNRFVTNGGTLLLELNGAERANIPLPRGVMMVPHGAKDNAIILTNHPLVDPLGGQPIHANYASHGYLEGVPQDALILAAELDGATPAMTRPTYVEYKHGKGRVIAACQCFHDQDGSGRGILMEAAIVYVADRQWYTPKK